MGILLDICKDNNIRVHHLTDEIAESLRGKNEAGSGYAVEVGDEKHIFFKPSKSHMADVNVVAHELAHILFDHKAQIPLGAMQASISNNYLESEARIFAAVFSALILWDKYRNKEDRQLDTEVSA